MNIQEKIDSVGIDKIAIAIDTIAAAIGVLEYKDSTLKKSRRKIAVKDLRDLKQQYIELQTTLILREEVWHKENVDAQDNTVTGEKIWKTVRDIAMGVCFGAMLGCAVYLFLGKIL